MSVNVAILGATGAVGREMLSILEERKFPVNQLSLFASQRSVGEQIFFQEKPHTVSVAQPEDFKSIDIALFSPGASVSKEMAPIAKQQGAIVIDNSSAFRRIEKIPLVVPEVNGHLVTAERGQIISNPNCSTIQMAVALAPIHARFGLKRIIVSTYQAVSGGGQKGMEELSGQVEALYNHQDVTIQKFPKQIAFNVIPQGGTFLENGYETEEDKLMFETRKILNDQNIKITATVVRVPVMNSHSESVYFETFKKATIDDILSCLKEGKGIRLPELQTEYFTPLDISGFDDVYVSRVRKDLDYPNSFHLWVVADNLRKGAALNAVQIAELILQKKS